MNHIDGYINQIYGTLIYIIIHFYKHHELINIIDSVVLKLEIDFHGFVQSELKKKLSNSWSY